MSKALLPYRVGHGEDFHRLSTSGSLWLGGIEITDSPYGTIAHSDGDVVFHALIDALLGAMALGDIGEYFPPSDPQYKNAASSDLLSAILPKITQAGYVVGNVNIIITLQAPKLKTYKPLIKKNVATLLSIDVSQVNVQAKTAEHLGPIGQHRAIGASVSILLIAQTN